MRRPSLSGSSRLATAKLLLARQAVEPTSTRAAIHVALDGRRLRLSHKALILAAMARVDTERILCSEDVEAERDSASHLGCKDERTAFVCPTRSTACVSRCELADACSTEAWCAAAAEAEDVERRVGGTWWWQKLVEGQI